MRGINASVGDQIRFSVSREINRTIFNSSRNHLHCVHFYPSVSWIMSYFNMNDIIVYDTDMLI